MHSEDFGKDKLEFSKEVERILRDAGNEMADFTGFVFPSVQFAQKELIAKCVFFQARFIGKANFRGATFSQGAHFAMSYFEDDADFNEVNFNQAADFTCAWFKKCADFANSNFGHSAIFDGAVLGNASFSGVTFAEGGDFLNAHFDHSAYFLRALFLKEANFAGARFNEKAVFVNGSFHGNTQFRNAIFGQTASFDEAKFDALLDFTYARFTGQADFRETRFRRDEKALPGPVFSLSEFCLPEEVVFYKTYLGQAVFHNRDVSRVTFSSVEWRERKGNRKWMVFEEEIDLSDNAARALKPSPDNPNDRDYGLIAELYQQLKKNFDERRDYWTAGDFHYGEMEMKRLSTRSRWRINRWLHRNLGLAAFYKHGSEYGESYLRPAKLLIGVLLMFGLLYPLTGLYQDRTRDTRVTGRAILGRAVSPQTAERFILTYWQPFVEQDDEAKWRARNRLVWNSMLTSVFTALFQRDLIYDPAYPGGRILAVLEQALTSTLFAIFLLAIRRQFRR